MYQISEVNRLIEKIHRLPNKIKRIALQIPLWKFQSKQAYNKALKKNVKYLPKLSPSDSILVDFIRQEGVFITSLEALAIPDTSLLINGTKKLRSELQAFPSDKRHAISLPKTRLINYPKIFSLGNRRTIFRHY